MDCGISNGVCVMEAKDEVVKPLASSEQPAPLGPRTPDAGREVESVSFHCDSPRAAVKKLQKLACPDSNINRLEEPFALVGSGSPRTPKDSVFDPFAPGPEAMALAPLCKKYIDRLKVSVARQLSFDSYVKGGTPRSENDDLDSISDREVFNSVYENLLEFIISKQMECLFDEISSIDWDYDDAKTPPSAPRLSGVGDSCPGAPVKPAGKSRIVDLSLCRKLF